MSVLDSPCQIGKLQLKNRFVRAATMENMADLDGCVTDDLLRLYYELARGGAALIITGCAAVESRARAWAYQLGVWDDTFVEGLSTLSSLIHEYGEECACALQISHQGSAGYGYSYGALDRACSLEDMRDDEIEMTIRAFGEAARRAREAGFDAVQVHGAHGYLVSQFLSPATNRREDQWGGNPENCARFPLEVYRAIRKNVGDDFPVLWKMNTADYIEGGLDTNGYTVVAGKLAKAGVDLIEMSGGIKEQIKLRAQLMRAADAREAYFESAVATFRNAVGETRLTLTGGIRSLSVMENLLSNGVDFIGLCRPLICEPDFPNRVLLSPDKRRAKCTSCNKCLMRISRQSVKCVEFDEFLTGKLNTARRRCWS